MLRAGSRPQRRIGPSDRMPGRGRAMSDTTQRYAVFGHPIAHSLSPQIHRAFAAQRQAELDYVDIGGVGANVTLPLKSQAYDACAKVSDFAARTGVANTLEALPGHGWRGHN